jgi:hypothetical protein
MSNIAFLTERTAAGTVNAAENVIFDTIIFSAGNISYNNVTGVITFNESGRYVINWWVSTQLSQSTNGVVFTLSSSKGDLHHLQQHLCFRFGKHPMLFYCGNERGGQFRNIPGSTARWQ